MIGAGVSVGGGGLDAELAVGVMFSILLSEGQRNTAECDVEVLRILVQESITII